MNHLSSDVLNALWRTTVALSLAAPAVWALLKISRSSSPALHRAAWIAVLLQGWLFLQWTYDVSWYEPPSRLPMTGVLGEPVLAPLDDAPAPPVGTRADAALPSVQPVRTSQPATASGWRWQAAIVAFWLSGMAVVVLRWAVSYARFAARLPLGKPADADDEQAWRRLLHGRGIDRPIPLRVVEGVGPVLCRVVGGYRLLLPRAQWSGLASDARLAILRHELAHYERRDVWKSLAARVLALPQWFNPLAWWVVANFDEAAEWACDGAVRRACPEGSPAYGRALLALATGGGSPGVLRTAARGRRLEVRIRRLLVTNFSEDSTMKKMLVIGLAGVLLIAGASRMRLVARAEDEGEATAGIDAKLYPNQLRGMAKAAEGAWELAMTRYLNGMGSVNDLYPWSRRLLDAERQLAQNDKERTEAFLGHWKRMKRAAIQCELLVNSGQTGDPEQAGQFYALEAEIWLLTAGGQLPENAD